MKDIPEVVWDFRVEVIAGVNEFCLFLAVFDDIKRKLDLLAFQFIPAFS